MNVSQVILFCNYTSNKTRSHLQLSDMKFDNLIRRTLGIPALKYIDSAPWIESFIRFFQRRNPAILTSGLRAYNNIEQECTHSWDVQLVYARLKSGALGIVPAKNLIHNIGEFGTHSSGHQAVFDLQEELSDLIRHPLYVLPNREYESITFP